MKPKKCIVWCELCENVNKSLFHGGDNTVNDKGYVVMITKFLYVCMYVP